VDKNCRICFGIGWVCENHPNRAWDAELGCVCGMGMQCECNQEGEPGVDLPDTSQVIEENGSTKH
jgi:hypothetical protein